MPHPNIETLHESLRDILRLKLQNPGVSLARRIKTAELHRPGLALAGFTYYFTYDRIQVLGKTEMTYLIRLKGSKRKKALKDFFSYRIPCIIITKNQIVPNDFLEFATKAKIPVLKTPLATATVTSRITVFLEEEHAEEASLHGTLVDVYGVGTLLLGKSGVGKSECALELVERGHRLVADDIIRVKLHGGSSLTGYANTVIKHFMEIRGIGLIDVKNIFGVEAVRNAKRIDLVVTLEFWKKKKQYERLGLDEVKYKILDIPLPHLILPVKPGRNLPVMVEVAALTERSKHMGVNSSKSFNQSLLKSMGVGEAMGEIAES